MIHDFSQFLNEKLYQGRLNPTFWKNEKLDSKVRTLLLQIANDFYKDLDIKAEIEDIQLTGSLANFNWSRYSDLDVHVILDFSAISDDKIMTKRALDGHRFIWNMRHPVIIKKHDVELYAQDIKETHISSGLYSILNDKWITKPSLKTPIIDEKDIERKAEGFILEIKNAQNDLKKATPEESENIYNRLNKIKTKILKARREGLSDSGEFSIENLTFKKLRNEGWIKTILELSAQSYKKIYSI